MADRLTPQQRSYCMSRIRGFDSSPEVRLRTLLWRTGIRYRANVQYLPGRPDIVVTSMRLVVFVDGDFWHGYRFPAWRERLSPYWQAKIERNRRRDLRNRRLLRRAGWSVIRVWEHQVKTRPDDCVARVVRRIEALRLVQ